MIRHVHATTDEHGQVTTAHDLGVTPAGVLVAKGPQATPALNWIAEISWATSDASEVTVIARNRETREPIRSTPVTFSMQAFV